MGADNDSERVSDDWFPGVFSRYGGLLARAISRLVRPHEVEDIVQETYMRVFRAAQTHPIRSPRAFMLKTARNVVLDKLAKADALNHVDASLGDRTDADDEPLGYLRDELTPDAVLESEQEFIVLCRAIRELPRQCRRVFLLKKVYGLSQREIAEKLAVSEGTVEKHIHKAMVECVLRMETSGYANRRKRKVQIKTSRTMP